MTSLGVKKHRLIGGAEKLVLAVAAMLLGLGLLSFMLFTNTAYINQISMASAVALCLIHKWYEKRSSNTHNWDRSALVLLIVYAAVTFSWAMFFDSIQVSDFGIYYRCGIGPIPHSLEDWINICQSQYLKKNLIYWNRSLLYTYPFGLVFGSDYEGLKLYNATLHILTLAIWFIGIREAYNSKIACLAAIFLGIYPEFWYSTTLATTDNLAILCLCLLFVIWPKLEVSPKSLAIVVVMLLLFLILEQLRSLGVLLIATVILSILLHTNMQHKRYAFRLTIVAMGFIGLSWLIRSYLPGFESGQFLKALAALDFSSSQEFHSNYPWFEYYWPAISSEAKTGVATQRILQEVIFNTESIPGYLLRKATILFSGIGYYEFSSLGSQGFNPDTAFTVAQSSVPRYQYTNFWSGFIVAFLTALSILAILFVNLKGVAKVCSLWSFAILLLVLGVSEPQARYSLLLAPSLSLLSAISIASLNNISIKPIPRLQSSQFLLGSATLCAIFIGLIATIRGYWTQNSIQPLLNDRLRLSAHDCSRETIQTINSRRDVKLQLYKGSECAIVQFSIPPGTDTAAFFISANEFPYLWEPTTDRHLSYQLLLHEFVVLNDNLGQRSVKWHKVTLPSSNSGKTRIATFKILRPKHGPDQVITISQFSAFKP